MDYRIYMKRIESALEKIKANTVDINTIFISFILIFIIFHPTLFLQQAFFDKSVLAPSQPAKLTTQVLC